MRMPRPHRLLDTSAVVQDARGFTTGVAVQLVTSEDGRKANVICQGANEAVGETEQERAILLLGRARQTDEAAQAEARADELSPAEARANRATRRLSGPAIEADVAMPVREAKPPRWPPRRMVALLQLELPLEPTVRVAAAAKDAGVAVVLKASPLPLGNEALLHKAETLLDGGSPWSKSRLGSTPSGHHGLHRLRLKPWGCPPHS